MTDQFDDAYYAQLHLFDILRIEPAEHQRRLVADLFHDFGFKRYDRGFGEGCDHMEDK